MTKIKEPLKTVLRKFCHVECYNPQLIREAVIIGHGFPYDIILVKAQLREAIDNQLITPEEYEELTDEDFDSQQDLQLWLEKLFTELP
ncbi:hypothetical protein SAMN06297280_3533 [Arsukibacterium tuosuense]|uniref:Uncharacterized protein n=1 Tax=Arsukibacterium tuosuense TaxID=1323745 RepID=A0A285JHW8_9GAMM|nr:hypothetical protein [Arsukibacterium tuosuense]SNY58976.1 hypothetical protein SAMN06297280_3533 [Arsukibacterium tuosuense]